MNTKETLTPPELARKWGVSPDKVAQLIANGELRAINLAVDPTGKPRYRIYNSEVERFEKTRMIAPPVEKPRRRRRQLAASGTTYF